MERRVDEHDLVRGPRLAQEAEGVGGDHLAAIRFQGGEIFLQLLGYAALHLQQRGAGRIAGQRFQPQRAAAGKAIEAVRVNNGRRQPVKKGFANPVGGRPQARALRHR